MRKIKNKTIAIVLAMAMMCSMTGCGKKTSEKSKDDTVNDITTTASFNYTDSGYDEKYEEEYEEEGLVYDSGVNYSDTADVEVVPVEEYPDFNTNEFSANEENSWMSVKTSPLSTFAADVDTASYTNIRKYITSGYNIDPSMVRIEEMVNYFRYDYKTPTEDDKFAVEMEYADCPWNSDTKIARITMATPAIDFKEAPASNIVFLVDTSGSMFDEDKLPLVQQSLMMLAENFTEKDRISIVTYAGSDEVVLDGVKGNNYYEICQAIEGLEAYGSTNGSAGINTAYQIAEKNFIKGGNNRVILATDGDLNVGVTSEGALTEMIKEKKESGVFLSVIGVGYGNYKDNKLEALADNGNGVYSYIDSIYEAKKALVENLGASMMTVAKDVKLQVEFNPANVKGYRLIGYENRVMAAEDFNDDTKDGGEMGAGHVVTALYEIALTSSEMEIGTSDLKYSDDDNTVAVSNNKDELFTVSVRYKEPDEDKSSLKSYVCMVNDYTKSGSDNLRWASAVAEFGLILKNSEYKGNASIDSVLKLANSTKCEDDEYKQEFISLVETYSNTLVTYEED